MVESEEDRAEDELGRESEDLSGEFAAEGASDQRDPPWFYPLPLLQFVGSALLGGWFFAVYWSYRNWSAYRIAWGYSRAPFWRDVYAATRYRVSPFWRAAFGVSYGICLFPAIDRECKEQGVRGIRAPVLLALGTVLLSALAGTQHNRLLIGLLSPALIMLPVQLAINRLNQRAARAPRLRWDPVAVGFVVIGALLTWR